MTSSNRPDPAAEITPQQRYRGLLLGTAVGDALGLPAEGLPRETIRRLGWDHWRHRLLFGRGMLSDDTEHSVLLALALLEADGNPDRFERLLAWKLRWWLLGLPAGIGLGTGRAIIKLWLGFPPRSSGVGSAGNGAAMRSAVIGVAFAKDLHRLRVFSERGARITHTDRRAQTAATAMAICAAFAANNGHPEMFPILIRGLAAIDPTDAEWQLTLSKLARGLSEQSTVADFAAALGQEKAVSGYAYHSVPVALYAFMRHFGNYARTLTTALDCGGDTDTVGAMAGALAGIAGAGEDIPEDWVRGLAPEPCSPAFLHGLARALARGHAGEPAVAPRFPWVRRLPRNGLFFGVVLFHGLLRLLPVGLRRRLIP